MDQYVEAMDKGSHSSPSSQKGNKDSKKVPSVLKMMETDSELKDFFRLIHKNGYRDKAILLLKERIGRLH